LSISSLKPKISARSRLHVSHSTRPWGRGGICQRQIAFGSAGVCFPTLRKPRRLGQPPTDYWMDRRWMGMGHCFWRTSSVRPTRHPGESNLRWRAHASCTGCRPHGSGDWAGELTPDLTSGGLSSAAAAWL
jgi:hypothetical protein